MEDGALLLRCAVGERMAGALPLRAGVLRRINGVDGGFIEASRVFRRAEVGVAFLETFGQCHVRRRVAD